jgi:hypothetical protein
MNINEIIPEPYVKDMSEKIWAEMKIMIGQDIQSAIREDLKWRVHSVLRETCKSELGKLVHTCVDQKIKDMHQEVFDACQKGLNLLKKNLAEEVVKEVAGRFSQWDVSNKVRDLIKAALKEHFKVEI